MSPLLKENTIYIEEKVNKCVRCNDIIYPNVGNHDCTASLLQLIFKMENQINSITSMYQQLKTEKQLSYIQLQTQISKLSHKLDSSLQTQNTNIIKQLKSNNNQIQHQIQFNFIQILKKQQKITKNTHQSIQTNQININSTKSHEIQNQIQSLNTNTNS